MKIAGKKFKVGESKEGSWDTENIRRGGRKEGGKQNGLLRKDERRKEAATLGNNQEGKILLLSLGRTPPGVPDQNKPPISI